MSEIFRIEIKSKKELYTDYAQISGDNKYRWYPMVPYPFAQQIFKYTTTSIGNSVYFIGGLIYDKAFSTGLGTKYKSNTLCKSYGMSHTLGLSNY